MNLTVDELIAEIGRLHIQVLAQQGVITTLQNRVKELTPSTEPQSTTAKE